MSYLSLDNTIQSGQKAPKWDPHVRVGMCVGKSPFHDLSTSLVMNASTGLISPQFHCIFDDSFTTVASIRNGHEPPNWNNLARHSHSYTHKPDFTKTNLWKMNASPKTSIPPHLPATNSEPLGFGIPSSQPSTIELPTMNPPLMQSLPSVPLHAPQDPINSSTDFTKLTPIAPATSSRDPCVTQDNNNTLR